MDRNNIEKIARTPEDKLLLAKIYDKISNGIRKNIPANTAFLSQREQELSRFLVGNTEGILFHGGYEDAQRKMLIYLPEYLDPQDEDNYPFMCLRAKFYEEDHPTHRDFLGALIGCGIARECIGDICVGANSCDFFVTAEIAPYILQNFSSAGRTKLQVEAIPICEAYIPRENTQTVQDTVASLRLDNIISAGFQISRSLALTAITTGRVSINGLLCEKPEKQVDCNAIITVRGFGKFRLTNICGITKKGRISVVIDRYI